MAYMTKEGEGPYPCHAGDYCGNHDPKRNYDGMTFDNFRFGRPRPTKVRTTEELEAWGMVGLYLKRSDSHIFLGGEILIKTPPELCEPEGVDVSPNPLTSCVDEKVIRDIQGV